MTVTAFLKTPSKINLFLRVAGKRKDSYHDIESIFLPMKDICDVVKLRLNDSSEIKVSSSSKEIPCNNANLCFKASKNYLEKASIKHGLDIHIEKHIPVAAGMGGGSSDAAAVLLILQDLFNALTEQELSETALDIGADVPFFLNPVPSAGYGVGNLLEPIEFKHNFKVIICAPQFPVSAAWAYKNWSSPGVCTNLNIKDMIRALGQTDYDPIIPLIRNDLALSLYNKFPLLQSIREDMLAYGLDAVEITGSGPTLFGVCKNTEIADSVLTNMQSKYGSALLTARSEILLKSNQIIHE